MKRALVLIVGLAGCTPAPGKDMGDGWVSQGDYVSTRRTTVDGVDCVLANTGPSGLAISCNWETARPKP